MACARFLSLIVVVLALGHLPANAEQSDLKTEFIILITCDGLRHQELFGGADPLLIGNKEKSGTEDPDKLRKRFWRETPIARREALLPFFWGTLAGQGVVLGNPKSNSSVKVTNKEFFSYPGYAEILTGQAIPEIKSNDPIRSPRVTVLEYVRTKLGLKRTQVAAFCSWANFNGITSKAENAIVCNAGFEAIEPELLTPGMRSVNELQFKVATPWDTVRHDWVTVTLANEYLKKYTPKLTYVALGETDDWAHERRYDRVLEAIHQFDESLRILWQTIQSHDVLRGRTTLVIASDHGRGSTVENWVSHNTKTEGSDDIWIAVIGPDTPNRGEAKSTKPYFQNQIAATILRLYGLDHKDFNPNCGEPIDAAFE